MAAPADGGPIAPWKAAEQVRASLFDAQTALLLDEAPEASVGVAREAFERGLERELERTDPRAAADARAALARAATALAGGDETGLAAARGSLVAALRRGAYAVTLEAVEASDVATARRWILVRDFRQATRYTRPGVDATAALDALEAGEIAPGRGSAAGPARTCSTPIRPGSATTSPRPNARRSAASARRWRSPPRWCAATG